MQELTDQLESAGLDNQECPMMDCFGHLNFIPTNALFKCSICGEVFPTTKAMREWAKTNREVKAVVAFMLSEDKAKAEEVHYE